MAPMSATERQAKQRQRLKEDPEKFSQYLQIDRQRKKEKIRNLSPDPLAKLRKQQNKTLRTFSRSLLK